MASKIINMEISLQGSEEIRKNLEALASAGEKAFEQISKSADKVELDKLSASSETAAGGLAKVGDAGQKTSEQLDKVQQSTDKASDSMSKLSESLQAAKEAAGLIKELIGIGIEIEKAVTKTNILTNVLKELAKQAIHVPQAFALLNPTLATTAVVLGTTAVVTVAAAKGLEALGKAALAAAGPYDKLNHDLQMLAQSSGQSFESLQRGEALFAQLGIKAEEFRSIVGKVAAELEKTDVGDALKKSQDSIVEANKKVLEAEKAIIEQRLQGRQVFLVGEDERMGQRVVDLARLKQIQAELNSETDKARALEDALLAARQKAAEAAANSLSKVLEQVKAIEAGQKGITFDSLVTAETKIKAVAISMKQATDAGQNAGQVLVAFLAAADKASAIQIGKQFGLNEEQVDRIQRLSGHLKTVDEIWRRIQGAGVLIPPEAAAALEKMRTQTQETERAWTRLQQALESSIFARVGAEIISTTGNIKAAVFDLAASMIEALNRVPDNVMKAWQVWANGIEALIRDIGAAAVGVAATIAQAFAGITFGDVSAKFAEVARSLRTTQQELSQSADEFRAKGIAAWNSIGENASQNAAKVTQATQTITTAMQQVGQGLVGLQAQKNLLQQFGGNALEAAQKFDQLRNAVSVMAGGPVTVDAYRLALQAMNGDAAKATQLLNELAGTAQAVGQAASAVQPLTGSVAQVGQAAQSSTTALQAVGPAAEQAAAKGAAAFDDMAAAIRKSASTILQELTQMNNPPASGREIRGREITGRQVFARGGMVGGRGSGTSDSNLAWLSRGEFVMPARAVGQPGVLALLEALRRSGGLPAYADGGLAGLTRLPAGTSLGVMDSVRRTIIAMGHEIAGMTLAVINPMQSVMQTIDRTMQTFSDTSERLIDMTVQMDNLLSDFLERVTGHARGGLLGGRGSGTSDSNLAWVSRGEHVMPAAAVSQPGVLAFLEALRRSGGDLSWVLDHLGRFAAGGLVTMPALAGGGLGSMNHVTIQFPGLAPISGLRASSDVVDELQRAAAMAQVRSGGRKPSRYT